MHIRFFGTNYAVNLSPNLAGDLHILKAFSNLAKMGIGFIPNTNLQFVVTGQSSNLLSFDILESGKLILSAVTSFAPNGDPRIWHDIQGPYASVIQDYKHLPMPEGSWCGASAYPQNASSPAVPQALPNIVSLICNALREGRGRN